MRFGAIVAARTDSRRLPGKAIIPLIGIPAIALLLRRIKTSKLVSQIIFATTILPDDDKLAAIVKAEGIEVFRGANEDVLCRYVEASKNRDFNYAVRITGDCPFVDGETLDYVLQKCIQTRNFDLVTTKPFYPHGIDYEIYPISLMENIYINSELTLDDREHVTSYIYRNAHTCYRVVNLNPPEDLKIDETIFLLDTPTDYSFMTKFLAGINDIHIKVPDLIKRYRSMEGTIQNKVE